MFYDHPDENLTFPRFSYGWFGFCLNSKSAGSVIVLMKTGLQPLF